MDLVLKVLFKSDQTFYVLCPHFSVLTSYWAFSTITNYYVELDFKREVLYLHGHINTATQLNKFILTYTENRVILDSIEVCAAKKNVPTVQRNYCWLNHSSSCLLIPVYILGFVLELLLALIDVHIISGGMTTGYLVVHKF